MIYFSTLLLAMFVTVGLIPIFSRAAIKLNVVDRPNDRKVHSRPVPRIGGVAMALGIFLTMLFQDLVDPLNLAIFLGAIVIVLFGVIDDLVGLSYRVKFTAQIIAALIVILYGGLSIVDLGTCLPENCHLPIWIATPLTLVTIVAVTNAVNLADGLDGLAGGIMLLAFICICILGISLGNRFVTISTLSIIGSILGFLRFNTHPAKIFMGDTGSQLLGYFAITLTLCISQNNGVLSPLLPLLLFGFPLVDTLVVMVERISRGHSPFKADRNHFHHKLLDIGFFHTETVFIVYSIQTLFVVSAYLLRFYSEWLIIGWFILLLLLFVLPFYYSSHINIQLRRAGVLDTFLKKNLRIHLKEKLVLLRIVQPTLEYGVPAIFLFCTLFPMRIPAELGLTSILLFTVVLVSLCFNSKYSGALVRVCSYLILPLVMFQCVVETAPWFGSNILKLFICGLIFLVLITLLVLRNTRRKKGFRPTPTDYLIVLAAIILAKFPQTVFANENIGFWGTCLLVFFFSVEVLLGEIRENGRRGGVLLLPSLLIIAFRAM